MPTKIKWKIASFCHSLLYIVFQIWEGTSVLISVDIIFHNFSELHSTLSETEFRDKFSFFNGFIQLHTPDPLNIQNLLSVTNFFCQFSPRCPLKHFFSKICWQNPAKASFMYQQWTATATVFLKVPTTDSLVFFSEHISRTAISTQASTITCRYHF